MKAEILALVIVSIISVTSHFIQGYGLNGFEAVVLFYLVLIGERLNK